MGTRVLAGLLMLVATNVCATDVIDATRLMPQLAWEKRVLLVFAPHRQDAGFRQQDAMLETISDGLIERDVTVIRAFADNSLSVDGRSYEQWAASFYQHFAVNPGEFRVILVGKDGGVKLDQNSVLGDADLFALIDSMPMRRDEMLQDG